MAKRTGKRVMVTGASRGIGRAAAIAFAARGDDVVLVARSSDGLAAAAREAEALGVHAEAIPIDVTDQASVTAGVERALARGPVDTLVNNAGVFQQTLFLSQDPAWQRHELDVNYFGAQRVTRAILPSMIARGAGTIVNVSSLIGSIPCPTVANYCASKAALDAWSHALRGEVAHHGVRVVVFIPSHTETEQAMETTSFDGVPAMKVSYTVKQLLHAADRAPRRFAVSPVFRAFLRVAGIFPGWAEGQMRKSTRRLVDRPAIDVDRRRLNAQP